MVFLSVILLLGSFFYLRRRTQALASFPLSFYPIFSKKTYRVHIHQLGNRAFVLALFLMAAALLLPNESFSFLNTHNQQSFEPSYQGMSIYLLIDKSGSMNEAAPTSQHQSKITWAKQIATHLVQERPHDMLGLLAFARAATIVCPLTLAHNELLINLQSITPVTDDTYNGTAIGYALFKTANLISATNYFAERDKSKRTPIYTTEKKAIIVLTDGLQSPHPDDKTNPYRFMPLEDALAFCQENDIQVFYVAVDPILKSKELAVDTYKTQKAVEKTGGTFYIIDDNSAISSLDTKLPPPSAQHESTEYKNKTVGVPIHTILIAIAMLFFLFGCLSETIFARSVP